MDKKRYPWIGGLGLLLFVIGLFMQAWWLLAFGGLLMVGALVTGQVKLFG